MQIAQPQPGAFPAGPFAGNERGHLNKWSVVARVDPRALGRQAGPVGPRPQGRRLVRAEQKHVAVPRETEHVLLAGRLQPLPGYRNVAVQAAQPGNRRIDLWLADVIFRIDDLPAEIGQLNRIEVNAVQFPDAGRGQRHGRDSASAA